MTAPDAAPPPEVLVVGSLNMDLVARTPRLPARGETVLGESFHTVCGGKGGNQAVACTRLGARTAMLGCVGSDAFGVELRGGLTQAGVDTAAVRVEDGASGVALIAVDADGHNSIVVAPGANALLRPEDIDAQRALLQACRIIVLQLETPLATVVHAAQLARSLGKQVVLNPAPAQTLPDSLLESVDWLVPNETEAALLSGVNVTSPATAHEAAEKLRARGVPRVLVTLGAQGVLALGPEGARHFAAPRVDAVDSTAAGDTFIGGLCSALARREALADAIAYAQAAAALSVTRTGAQSSIPTRAETMALLQNS